MVSVTSTFADELDYEDDYDYAEFNFTTNGTLQFVRELTNLTRDPGKMVRMVCEVKNLAENSTKVTFNWLKFSAPIPRNDRRITIKQINVICFIIEIFVIYFNLVVVESSSTFTYINFKNNKIRSYR